MASEVSQRTPGLGVEAEAEEHRTAYHELLLRQLLRIKLPIDVGCELVIFALRELMMALVLEEALHVNHNPFVDLQAPPISRSSRRGHAHATYPKLFLTTCPPVKFLPNARPFSVIVDAESGGAVVFVEVHARKA